MIAHWDEVAGVRREKGEMAATWHRVDYPIDEAADAIRAAGLPRALSDRLFQGQ